MSKPSPRGNIKSNAPQTLYRFWNHKELLYVGISQSFLSRMDKHESTKNWWPKVTHITVTHYPNRKSVELAEKTAIRTEHPTYNLQHQPDWEQYNQHIKNIVTGAIKTSNKFDKGSHDLLYSIMALESESISKVLNNLMQSQQTTSVRFVQAYWVISSYKASKSIEVAGRGLTSCRACESLLETEASIRMYKHGAAIMRKHGHDVMV